MIQPGFVSSARKIGNTRYGKGGYTMTYIGMSWIDTDLRDALADPYVPAAVRRATADTALINTIRVGLGKVGVEVARLTQAQAETASAMNRVADALERQTAAFKQAQGLHTGETVPAEDYDPHYNKDGTEGTDGTEGDDDLMIANLGGGGFVVGRRDAFKDEDEEEEGE